MRKSRNLPGRIHVRHVPVVHSAYVSVVCECTRTWLSLMTGEKEKEKEREETVACRLRELRKDDRPQQPGERERNKQINSQLAAYTST